MSCSHLRSMGTMLLAVALSWWSPQAWASPAERLSTVLLPLMEIWGSARYFAQPELASLIDHEVEQSLTSIALGKSTLNLEVARLSGAIPGGRITVLSMAHNQMPSGEVLEHEKVAEHELLYVNLSKRGTQPAAALAAEIDALLGSVGAFRTVVVDVRLASSSLTVAQAVGESSLAKLAMPASAEITQSIYRGLPSELPGAPTPFYRGTISTRAASLAATHRPSDGSSPMLVFVVDRNSVLPAFAMSGQRSIRILATEPLSHLYAHDSRVPVIAVSIGIDHYAVVALGTARTERAEAVIGAQLEFATKARTIEAAVRLASDTSPRPLQMVLDSPKSAMSYTRPSTGPADRAFGIGKTWYLVKTFFAYPANIPKDWDALAIEALRRATSDRATEVEYALALGELLAALKDTHVSVNGAAWHLALGSINPPIELKTIQGRVYVSAVCASAIGSAKSGDEVVEIDGAPLANRASQLRRHRSVSSPAAFDERLAAAALLGPAGSEVRLGLRREGQVVTATLKRVAEPCREYRAPSTLAIEPSALYLDLTRLTPDQFRAAMNGEGTRSTFILDLRGAPRVPLALLSQHFGRPGMHQFATMTMPVRTGDSQARRGRIEESWVQSLYVTPREGNIPSVVLLVDSRTSSQGEFIAMALIEAAKASVVGTATNGTNGDVTGFLVPGGLTVRMSGAAVSGADGSRFQGNGVRVSASASTTAAGLAEGKDQQLDEAIRIIKTNHR